MNVMASTKKQQLVDTLTRDKKEWLNLREKCLLAAKECSIFIDRDEHFLATIPKFSADLDNENDYHEAAQAIIKRGPLGATGTIGIQDVQSFAQGVTGPQGPILNLIEQFLPTEKDSLLKGYLPAVELRLSVALKHFQFKTWERKNATELLDDAIDVNLN